MPGTIDHSTWAPLEMGPYHPPPPPAAWWSEVRILDLHAERGDPALRERPSRVRACVALGALTPADVRVDVHAGRLSAADAGARPEGLRMWSTQSYDNGSYVFEANVPPEIAADAEGFSVRVRPAVAAATGAPLPPVAQWCATRAD